MKTQVRKTQNEKTINKKVKRKANKRGIEMDMLGWWLIAIVVLVILIFAIMMLKGKGVGAIEYIQNLFRFKTAG